MAIKRQMPARIKPKTFQHPQETIRLIQVFENPRKPSCNFQYSLTSILFIVLIKSLCGAYDWCTIDMLAK